jgi:hypothetical protein
LSLSSHKKRQRKPARRPMGQRRLSRPTRSARKPPLFLINGRSSCYNDRAYKLPPRMLQAFIMHKKYSLTVLPGKTTFA